LQSHPPLTFNVLIFTDATGKKSECQKGVWVENKLNLLTFDIIYGVLNDQNVDGLFNSFLTFVVLFNVLIFNVLAN
jgi:hypothetical protein